MAKFNFFNYALLPTNDTDNNKQVNNNVMGKYEYLTEFHHSPIESAVISLIPTASKPLIMK